MKSLIYETQLLEYTAILYNLFHHNWSFKILTEQIFNFNPHRFLIIFYKIIVQQQRD